VTESNGKVDKDCQGYTLLSCMLATLRVLLNITHDNELGSSKTGQQEDLVQTVLKTILHLPQFVPVEQRFDILVLGLGLLINMVEHSDGNKHQLVDSRAMSPYDATVKSQDLTAIEALMQLFHLRYEAALRMEEEQDEEKEKIKSKIEESRKAKLRGRHKPRPIGDSLFEDLGSEHGSDDEQNESGVWQESESGLEWVQMSIDGKDDKSSDSDCDSLDVLPGSQEVEQNITKALHKAGRHMEDSIVAAYISLLLGCMLQNNSALVEQVREHLSDGSFEPLIYMLRKFLGFMNLIAAANNTGGKSIMRVIEILEAC